MSKISDAFKNGRALIPFVTAGDPDLETSARLLVEMSKNGADIIEIGIPFSDPIAEGVAVQEADLRALAAGVTTDKIFDMVKAVRADIECELAVMTYMNPVFVYGAERFMSKCAECGISALIVPDVPFEEKAELSGACGKCGVDLISFAAYSTGGRVKMIANDAQGFVYCVPGAGSKSMDELAETVSIVKSVNDIPCAVDFGASAPEQAKQIAEFADGVIISSAVVEIAAKHGKDCVKPITDYIKSLKQAITTG